MKLEALIKELQAIFALYGDVPVLLSTFTPDDEGEEMLVHGDAQGVAAEHRHDSEGMFVRITGDGLI